MSAIEVKQLTKQFKGQTVLHGIDLAVDAGEVVAIIGPSGSGKTTLLRCINLLEELDSGTIRVGDILIDGSKPLSKQKNQVRALRQQVGFVFQNFNLFPHRSVLENIIEGPVIVKGEAKASAEQRARVAGQGGIERQGAGVSAEAVRRPTAASGYCARAGDAAGGDLV